MRWVGELAGSSPRPSQVKTLRYARVCDHPKNHGIVAGPGPPRLWNGFMELFSGNPIYGTNFWSRIFAGQNRPKIFVGRSPAVLVVRPVVCLGTLDIDESDLNERVVALEFEISRLRERVT